MATDPNLLLPENEPELGLGQDAMVLEPPVAEGPEEVQVAGPASLIGKAVKKAEDIPQPMPEKTPVGEVVDGQLIITPVDEGQAKQFREMFGLPEDQKIEVPLPNMTRTINKTKENPAGDVVNIMDLEDSAVEWVNTLHRMFDSQIKASKRGERSLDQIARSARSMGMHEAVLDLMRRKPGEPFNSEQMYRALWVRAAAATHLDRLAKTGTDEEFMQWLPVAASIEIQTAGGIGETARGLTVLSHAGRLGMTDSSLKNLPDIVKAYGMTDETVGDIRAAYLAIPETRQKMGFLRSLREKGANVWAEAYLNALLSSPVTDAINILSNTIFGAIQIPERLISGAVGSVRVNLFGGLGGKDRAYMSESWAQLQSLSQGIPIGLKAAWRAMRHEEGTFGKQGVSKVDARTDRAISSDHLNLNPQSALGKFVDYTGIITRFMGSRLLLAEDEFAKGVTYTMELRAQAQRRMLRAMEEGMDPEEAVNLGAKILSGQDATIVKSAEEFAVRTTFQNDLGVIGKYMQGAFSHPLMKVFVPFFRTPTNIIKETLQRTPLALVTPSGFRSEFAQGGAKADAAMGRMIMGTGVFATIAGMSTGEMVDGFKITGAGPKDKNANAAWKRLGWKPYSFAVRQENGTWKNYEYGRLAPVAGIIAMAADYAHYSQYEDDDANLDELMLNSANAMYNVIKELPMLQGIFSLTDIAGSEYESTPKKFNRAWELLVKQFGTAALTSVPILPTGSLTATVERTLDPLASNVKPSSEDLGEVITSSPTVKGFYEALNKLKSRNPFFSEEVAPKLNLWGETMKQCENGAWCFISPIRTSTTKFNDVDQEMVNLGLGLRMPSRIQQGVKLTSDQYNEMILEMNLQGKMTMQEEMSEFIKTPQYDNAPIGGDNGKLQLLKSIMTRRKNIALKQMFYGDGDLQWKKEYLDAFQEKTGTRLEQ